MRLKKFSSLAWNCAQKPFAASWQAFALEGASPNHCATSAFAFGLMMWFIHMYMQLGCLACEEIIHVSDQPVPPSLGSVVLTGVGFLSPVSRFAMNCQVVPISRSPPTYAACSLA